MHVRRVLHLLAALIVLTGTLAMAGCGRDDDDDDGGGGGGLSAGPGFDGNTIKLGVITPLSGPVAVIGKPLTAGNDVWFDKVNAEGGIAGKYKVELVERDSRYEPPTSVQAYNRLKGDVAMFVQILGTPIIQAVLPQLERDGISAGPATLNSQWVRKDVLVPIGAPYQVQSINAVDYYLRTEGKGGDKNICSLVQDDLYGESGQQGLEAAAEAYDFEIAETARFRAGDKDFTGQIQQLRRADCDMVLLVATPSDTGTALGTAAQLKFAPRWIGQSPTWIGALAKSPLAKYLEQRMWIIAEGTEWGDTSVPGMKEMLDDIEKHRPNQEPDYYFAFGYNQGRAVEAVLEKAVENDDLSRDGIKKAITEVGTLDFGGLLGDYEYGPIDERDPPRENSIFEVDTKKPNGLGALEKNFTSDAAENYEIPSS